MAQPTPYEREFNFANQQALTPAAPLPANHIEAEYNRIKRTLDGTLSNLAKIQRDDGALANDAVGLDQLAPEVTALFGGEITQNDDIRNALDVAPYVQTIVDLKALKTAKDSVAFVKQAGRQGMFMWATGDYAARITADTTEALFVKADDVPANMGAWIRIFDGLPSVTWFGAGPSDIVADSAPAFQAAINLVGAFSIPKGTFNIASTLIVARDGVRMHGQGGLLDGAIVHYDDDLAGAIGRVGTRLIWTGAANGTIIRAQPYLGEDDVWRNGFGFGMHDMLLDCAEIANTGYQSLSHALQEHRNTTIVRYKYAGWDLGVSTNLDLGTSDSNGNHFFNCWAINRGAGSACIPGRGWWTWGDGGQTGVTIPRGNLCESAWFGGGSYPHEAQPVAFEAEYSDTCKFFAFLWSGKFRLNAWDTGVRGFSDGVATPGQNSQCIHFTFFGYGGWIELKKSIAHPMDYGYNPFAHTFYDFPLGNIELLPVIEGPSVAQIKVYATGTPAEPGDGGVAWGGSKALCTARRTSNLTLAHNTETLVAFQSTIFNPLVMWTIGQPSRVYVPMGVKKVKIKALVKFAGGGAAVGFNIFTLYKGGTILRQKLVPATGGAMEIEFDTRWISVVGGDYFSLTVTQQSGAPVDIVADATYGSPFLEVEYA